MKRVIKYLFIFIIMILSGCTNKESVSNIKAEKIVNNKDIVNKLVLQVKGIESLDKTIELYFNGHGNIKDYDDNDKILYGLNYALINHEFNNLSISSNVITNNISKVFDVSNIKYKSINQYLFNNDTYNIDTNYKEKNKKIISYIENVTFMDDYYYVTVFAGLINHDEIYGDFNQEKLVKLLDDNDIYEISEKDKNDYTEYKYKFKKDDDNNFIFVDLEKK